MIWGFCVFFLFLATELPSANVTFKFILHCVKDGEKEFLFAVVGVPCPDALFQEKWA